MSLGIKLTRPFRVAQYSFQGKPVDVTAKFDYVYAWARRRGVRTGERDSSGRMNLPWTAVYHNEINTTDDMDRLIELWMPLDGAGPSQAEFAVKDLDAENAAFMIHKGPMARVDETVQALFDWAAKKELPFRARLHRRLYTRGIDTHPEDPDWEAEIQIPLLASRTN